MRKDPSILAAVSTIIDNPNISAERLNNIINSLAMSGARCRTCDNTGTEGLRFIDAVLTDLNGFAKEFNKTPGFDDFLREMGEQGTKATGGSWTLEVLMRNRKKYFNGETITGFEIKHVPRRQFAIDVVSDLEGTPHFTEFKSWGSNLMSTSNKIDQLIGTMTVINNLDEMKFIFNPKRWIPTETQFKSALEAKSALFDQLMARGKLQELMPEESILSTSDFIDRLASPKYFNKVIVVQ